MAILQKKDLSQLQEECEFTSNTIGQAKIQFYCSMTGSKRKGKTDGTTGKFEDRVLESGS